MEPIVILTTFEEYLQGAPLDPIKPIAFKEIPIQDTKQYINSLINDRFLKSHGVKDGASLSLTLEELSLKVNSAYLEFIDGKIPLFLDIGHARNENGVYVLDKLFQEADYPLTNNQKIIGYSMASLMYHYAVRLQDKSLLA